jgi:hypothetical protein
MKVRVLVVLVALALLAQYLVPAAGAAMATRVGPDAGSLAHRELSGTSGAATMSPGWLSQLFSLYASGNRPIQDAAYAAGASAGLTHAQMNAVSAAVRQGWLNMAAQDPAAVGRVNTPDNPAAGAMVMASLTQTLRRITGTRYNAFVAASQAAFAQTDDPRWIAAHVHPVAPPAASDTVWTEVWATSYKQSPLPDGLNPQTSPYVAVPDAYIKAADWGANSQIPSIYTPFYGTTQQYFTVGIATSAGHLAVKNALVTDVGPWNEDDNWWDPTDTSTILPANCPVSSNLIGSNALDNAAVDGICPNNGINLRRVYYYLLYFHNGLPFFGADGYAPTGTFQSGTNWPTVLPLECSEAAYASQNIDGSICTSSNGQYNGGSGAWLRSGFYNSPILNQAAIDLSPAIDKALGWVYPSSGYVYVNVGRLP